MKLVLILTLLLITSCDSRRTDSYMRQQLPPGVSEIKEYYRDTGLSGDYIRLLKARGNKEDYEQLAKNLELTQKFSEALNRDDVYVEDRPIDNPPNWWDEPINGKDFYFNIDLEKEYQMRLKWKDGWIYVATISW